MEINLSQIKAEMSSAYDLLGYLAHLNACNIPRELMAELCAEWADGVFDESLNYLLIKSIVAMNLENRIVIDASIQQKVLLECSSESERSILEKSIRCLNGLIKDEELREPGTLTENLFYQALHVLEKNEKRDQIASERLAQLYEKVGRISELYLLDYERALNYSEKYLTVLRRISPTKSEHAIAECLQRIGHLYFQLKHYGQAYNHYEEAMSMCESVFPVNHVVKADLLHNMAKSLENQALEYYGEAMAMKVCLKKTNVADQSLIGESSASGDDPGSGDVDQIIQNCNAFIHY